MLDWVGSDLGGWRMDNRVFGPTGRHLFVVMDQSNSATSATPSRQWSQI